MYFASLFDVDLQVVSWYKPYLAADIKYQRSTLSPSPYLRWPSDILQIANPAFLTLSGKHCSMACRNAVSHFHRPFSFVTIALVYCCLDIKTINVFINYMTTMTYDKYLWHSLGSINIANFEILIVLKMT